MLYVGRMGDSISRGYAVDAICRIKEEIWDVDIPSPTVPEYIEHHEQMQELMKLCDSLIMSIKSLPDNRLMGYWIIDDDSKVKGHCSLCGWRSRYYVDDVIGMPFCPNCGALMMNAEEATLYADKDGQF